LLNEGDKNGVRLGHDGPEHFLDTASCDSLLSHPDAWLHCKNLAAFNLLRERPDSARFHFFIHDLDPFAFFKDFSGVYPGVELEGRGAVRVIWAESDDLPKGVKLSFA